MFLCYEFQLALVLKINDEDGDERHAGNKCACEGVPAIHGAEPMRIDAH